MMIRSSLSVLFVLSSIVALGCESDTTTTTPRKMIDSGMTKDGGGSTDAGKDGSADGGSIDRSILVSDLDESTLKGLCQEAQVDRFSAQPSDAELIKLYCTSVTGITTMPQDVPACKVTRDMCIADQNGVVPPETAVAFDLMCDSPPALDPDVTIGQLLDCWYNTNKKLGELKDEITCEAVVADPMAGVFLGLPECIDILLGDAGVGM
ncbi:MAG: hypothetical protein KC416_01230 [Myxococcales bacterium]|nr:hypothetical protein [Myxococcales bacterium]